MSTNTKQTGSQQALDLVNVVEAIVREIRDSGLQPVVSGNVKRITVTIFEDGVPGQKYVVTKSGVRGSNPALTGGKTIVDAIDESIAEILTLYDLTYNPDKRMYCKPATYRQGQ